MRIGTFLGIRVRLNWLFLLLLFVLGAVGLLPEALMVFGIVLIHEFAHAVAAKGYGLQVSEVELLPFGGVARIDDLIEVDPRIEARVAIAGPLANLFLIGVGLVFKTYGVYPDRWIDFFLHTNAALAGFNALPALPLDGGRVYRATLCTQIGFRRATQRAAWLGKVFALLFAMSGIVGLYLGYVNLTLLILGFFVYASALKEQKTAMYVLMRYLARKQNELQRHGCLASEQLVAAGPTPLTEVVKLFVPQRYHLVWVVNEQGQIGGLITEYDVINAMFEQGFDTSVSEVLESK